jgi:hypothetical protein
MPQPRQCRYRWFSVALALPPPVSGTRSRDVGRIVVSFKRLGPWQLTMATKLSVFKQAIKMHQFVSRATIAVVVVLRKSYLQPLRE